MSTTAIKLGSLVIRTLAKPIATRIKSQARDHPRFRNACITIAQHLHRVDMRLRLGLLRDTRTHLEKAEQIERQRRHTETLRKVKEAEAIYPGVTGRVRSDVPILSLTGDAPRDTAKETGKQKIRPLSESKAIDAGANFISEAFLFAVAGTLILFEALRSRRKEANRRDVVQERLELLENRNRQDEERLEELERAEVEALARVGQLEREVWTLKGGKGKFMGGEVVKKREWTPTPLWEGNREEDGNLWRRMWNFGAGGDRSETALVAEK